MYTSLFTYVVAALLSKGSCITVVIGTKQAIDIFVLT